MTYFCPKFDEEQSFFCKLVPENSFLGSKMRFFDQKHRFLTQKWSKRVKKNFFFQFSIFWAKNILNMRILTLNTKYLRRRAAAPVVCFLSDPCFNEKTLFLA